MKHAKSIAEFAICTTLHPRSPPFPKRRSRPALIVWLTCIKTKPNQTMTDLSDPDKVYTQSICNSHPLATIIASVKWNTTANRHR